MTKHSYVDFDLQVEWVGTGYRARVLDSPAGQAQADVSFPFSILEIENFVLRLGQRRGRTRRVESRELDAAREFGATLFQAMFHGDIASAYRSSLLVAKQQDSGVRVRLRLSGAPDLVDIPWEFLFDSSERRFVGLSTDSPIVRLLDVPGIVMPLKIVPPVRILAVIASPTDFEPLEVEAEWARLRDAMSAVEAKGRLTVERLARPTLAELQRALRRDYHVLHFVGHGGFDEKSQDGLLIFEDEQGRGNEVSATYLSTLLHDSDSLRLVVLNACDGARSSRGDQFAGVAQSLLQQGVPAVVAMQFEISDEAALTFAGEFYAAFAEGLPVEAALAEARKSMFAQRNDSEWATPVLYSRSGGSQLFEIAIEAAAEAGTPRGPERPLEEASEATRAADPEPAHVFAPIEAGYVSGPSEGRRGPIVAVPDPAPTEPSEEVIGHSSEQKEAPVLPAAGRSSEIARKTMAIGVGAMLAVVLVVGAIFVALRGEDEPDPPATPTVVTRAVVATSTADFNGTWHTNFARVELTQTGDTVSGRYFEYRDGIAPKTIKGTVHSNDLTATFDGDVHQMSFSQSDDGQSFSGYWMDPNGGSHEWCGNRDGELDEGCGYTGHWNNKGFPAAAEIAAGTVWITQNKNAATLEFTSRRYGDVKVQMRFDPLKLASAVGTVTMSAQGAPTLQFEFRWDVVDEETWDSIRGTWRTVGTATGAPVTWCAWKGTARPPC